MACANFDLTDLLERQSAEFDGEERDAQIDEAAQIILDRGLAFPVAEFSSIVAAAAHRQFQGLLDHWVAGTEK
ncbi:hypothetical protein [Promicromonospora sukumoe]|uniref:hypothetical protein n=1 Tax=Promicromonospora sukumoe TaxID=88382 RepID=UPI00364E38A9